MTARPRLRPYLTALAIVALLAAWWIGLVTWLGRDHATGPAPAQTAAHAHAVEPADDTVAWLAAGNDDDGELLALLRARLTGRDARADEVLLTFKDAAGLQRFMARLAGSGLSIAGRMDALHTVRVRYSSLEALRREFQAHSGDYAQIGVNALVRPPATAPAAEARAAVQQVPVLDHLLQVLDVAGDNSAWGRGVTIAILDSGVTLDPTFGSGRLRRLDIGYGLEGTGDGDGHGTAVAALAAGASADAAGVAPAANLLSIRVTDASGVSDTFTLAQAILAATDAGAQIINISMGAYSSSAVLSEAVAYASARGAVVVAAAGNDQAAQLTWPAAYPGVVSVGAVDAVGQQVLFSNSGEQLQITAPGYGVHSAWLDGQRVNFSGTSASAPVVSGAIAAVMSDSPVLSAQQAWALVQDYSVDAGEPGADASYGAGALSLGWVMDRNDPTRVDTAVTTQYLDASSNTLEVAIQNRGGRGVAGLDLQVSVGGNTTTQRIAWLPPGESQVWRVPLSAAQLESGGTITVQSTLVNPEGLVDEVPANNRRRGTLTTPGQ